MESSTIHFVENPLRPTRSNNTIYAGGVVPLRTRSRSRKRSLDVGKGSESGDAVDEDAGLRDERDFKRSQVFGPHQPIVNPS